jgi:hypothetical protein
LANLFYSYVDLWVTEYLKIKKQPFILSEAAFVDNYKQVELKSSSKLNSSRIIIMMTMINPPLPRPPKPPNPIKLPPPNVIDLHYIL